MTIDRSLDYNAATDGEDWAGDVDATLNYALGLNLGRLTNVAGTNTITADLTENTGFSSLTTNAHGTFIPANNNTGAATLEIEGGGAVNIRTNDDSALSADDLVAGTVYPFQYNSSEAKIRIMVDLPSQTLGSGKIGIDYQEFTSSGTWTKPSNISADARVHVEQWGGGGGGSSSSSEGAGGGGSYIHGWFDIDDLGSTETVTVGTGGATNNAGNNTSFGSLLTAYGGGRSNNTGGGGGGGAFAKGSSNNLSTGGDGGGPAGGDGGSGADGGSTDGFGGGGGGADTDNGGDSGFGGGGGGGDSGNGGGSVFGGGGGGGGNGGLGGASINGGDGGDNSSDGSIPGGGGGRGGAGARGECRVTTYG